MIKRLMLLAALALAPATPAAADYWGDFDTAIDAYANARYDQALDIFRPRAERGDDRAQYWLGIMYYEGKGVIRDNVNAYMWLSLAAERGNRAARLGREGIAGRMSASEIETARARVAAWH